MSAGTGFRPGRALVVAREEYRRAIESRWLFGFGALFAVFVLGLSFFGLAQSGEGLFRVGADRDASHVHVAVRAGMQREVLLGRGLAGGGEPGYRGQPGSRRYPAAVGPD